MKKLTAGLAAVVTALALMAGCGPKDAGEGSDQASTESAAPVQTEEGASDAADEAVISFETKDLEGNTVKSEDIFKEHKLTMVNLWGTYCGPCIGEMPDLEVLNKRLAEKDCAIIGVVIDIMDEDDSVMIDAALDIVSDTGVTYMNLIPWRSLGYDLPAAYIPTTYFIDSNGRIIGDPVVGAGGADSYEEVLEERLGELGY